LLIKPFWERVEVGEEKSNPELEQYVSQLNYLI
jgi:hypothetical protein